MAELGGIRTAVQTVTEKLANLKAAIEAFKGSTVAQDALDEIIADLQGTEEPATGETPPA